MSGHNKAVVHLDWELRVTGVADLSAVGRMMAILCVAHMLAPTNAYQS